MPALPTSETAACLLCGQPHGPRPCGAAVSSAARAGSGQQETPLGGHLRNPFVGRTRELGELLAGLDAAVAGRGRLFLLVGEPGIGKTRLADEVTTQATTVDALAVWGRCWDGGGAPTYWPWTQIVRNLLQADPGLESVLTPPLGELAQCESDRPGPPAATGEQVTPEHARFALFDATARFLKVAAGRQPLVLVLDDLHVADEASLLLLQFLARDLRTFPVLVLGTYREAEALRIPPIATALGALAREGHHIRLRGLPSEDIARFVAEAAGRPAPREVVQALYATTGGNPFFVEELVRLLVAEGRLDSPDVLAGGRIPPGVRATIRRRLQPLAPDTVRILEVASVVGREFELPVLERASEAPAETVLAAIDDALAVGVVGSASDDRPGRFVFAHPLIRETLYDDLASSRARHLHRAVADAIEQVHWRNLDPHLAILSHHYLQVADEQPDKAIDYAIRAGDRATRMLAYEQSVLQCVRALQVADIAGIGGERRCQLLLALGEAQSRAGDLSSARETFELVAELARGIDDDAFFALAALGCGGVTPVPAAGAVDASLVALLKEAAHRLGDRDPTLRPRILGRLAMELYYVETRSERERLTDEAVTLARRVGTPGLLAFALHARHFALWSVDDCDTRVSAANEILRLAEQAGDADLVMEARVWRIIGFLEQGDIAAADVEIAAHRHAADELRKCYRLWESKVFAAMRAGLQGDFALAHELAREGLNLGQRREDVSSWLSFGTTATMTYGIQEFGLARDEGRLAERETDATEFASRYPHLPGWRCALAMLRGESGHPEGARREIERVARQGFATLPRDGNWLVGMANLAEAVHIVGDRGHAAELYELLAPYAGRQIVVGRAMWLLGAVTHYLGLLAATMNDRDSAARHFDNALAAHEKMGARVLVARTRLAYGRLLASGRSREERHRAVVLLGQARGAYEELGIAAPAEAAAAALAEVEAAGPRAARSGATSARFQREGDYWSVAAGDLSVRIKDAKGMRYLARLVAEPNEEIHVLELVSAAHGNERGREDAGAEETELAWTDGDGELVLDAQAKNAYQRRLSELRAQVEEARAGHDLARAERLEAELDFIVQELSSSLGLRGRSRKMSSPAERARVAVTKAIRNAIRRIEENHAELGRHLEQSVRTGTFCSYHGNYTWEL